MTTEDTGGEGRDLELMDSEEVLLERYREQGYEHHFLLKGEEVHCPACDEVVPAASVRIDETGRFEGPSNPSDEAVVFAISDGPCGHRGVLVTAYGMAAQDDDAEGLRLLGTAPVDRSGGGGGADEPADDPITAREAAEQALIVEGDSEEGAVLGDEMP
jgi:hypothetical protein